MIWRGKHHGLHAYRTDDWGGGYYKFGFRIGRIAADFRWTIWLPVTVKTASKP